MKTEELEAYMLNDPYIRQYYGGVVALNQIPVRVQKPTIFIVNSDPSGLPGRHWYAVFFTAINEHFDSAGFYPNAVLEAELIVHGPRFCYNDNRVQAYNTETCGLFCLFYCYFRCRGSTFHEIMNMFSKNLQVNEFMVKYFYSLTSK